MHALRRTVAVAAVAFVGGAVGFATPALADFAVVSSTMTGAGEVPPTASTGSGTATVILDSGTGKICYFVTTTGLTDITAGHIHMGGAGTAGPVVIPFATPRFGFTTGCTTAALPLVQSIIDNPSGFYTNVHTTQFPGGAIRGQLSPLATLRRPPVPTVPAGVPTTSPFGVHRFAHRHRHHPSVTVTTPQVSVHVG